VADVVADGTNQQGEDLYFAERYLKLLTLQQVEAAVRHYY